MSRRSRPYWRFLAVCVGILAVPFAAKVIGWGVVAYMQYVDWVFGTVR